MSNAQRYKNYSLKSIIFAIVLVSPDYSYKPFITVIVERTVSEDKRQ